MKKLMCAVAVALAGGVWATDYTWNGGASGDWRDATKWSGGSSYPQSGDTATFNTAATVNLADVDEVDGLVLNARVLFTTADRKQHQLKTKTLSGTGKLALCQTYFYFKPTEATTVSMPMEFVKSENNLETRVLRCCAYDLTFTGAFTGDGTVRLLSDNGVGATSTQAIHLANDQSGFSGTLIYNSGVNIDRFMLDAATASSAQARYEVAGTQAGNIQTTLAEGTLSFGSIYTVQASSDKSFIRFNTASSTAVMEIGAANGEKGDDRLTLRMGNIDSSNGDCSYVKVRKVGTGNLDLGETRHSKGTEINDGTVTVVHPSALLANVKANTEISFGGGTLRYGASVYADTLGEDITTDYSAYIKNSTAPVSIDTNGKDITWKTALSTSNTSGITKKGEGTLKLDNWGDDNLNQFTSAERTILIEGGTLAVVNGRYNQTPNLNAKVLGTGTLRIDPSEHDGGFRLNSVDALNEFAGTLEWANDLDASQKAIGFLTRNGDYNLANLKFRVTGTPETAVEVLRSEMTNGRTLILGAMDHLSANAKIKFNETSKIKVTGDRGDSYLNGTFANKAITLIKGAKAKLTLGAGFNMLAGSTLEVEGGTFENHANLANYTVNLAAGTALAGDLTSVPAAKLTDYTVVLPAKESVDKKTVYDLVKVPAGAAAPTVDLTALNAGETKGKWKIRKNVQGVYQLFWAPTGLAIIVR